MVADDHMPGWLSAGQVYLVGSDESRGLPGHAVAASSVHFTAESIKGLLKTGTDLQQERVERG